MQLKLSYCPTAKDTFVLHLFLFQQPESFELGQKLRQWADMEIHDELSAIENINLSWEE